MHNSRDYHFKGRISFRALALSKKQAELFLDNVPDSKCKKYPEKPGYCGTVLLNEAAMQALLKFCRVQEIVSSDCDIFVSVSTQSDTEIVDVPPIVNDFLREFNCKLTFSFTVT